MAQADRKKRKDRAETKSDKKSGKKKSQENKYVGWGHRK